MFLQAFREFDIDPTESWMIGDINDDMIAGRNAGCRTILVDPKRAAIETMNTNTQEKSISDHIVNDLLQASAIILKTNHPGP